VIDRTVEWLLATFDLRPGSTVLDLGCGPGLYACRLAHRGVRVSGIDVSRRSISHARDVAAAGGLPARFRRTDYLRADLGRGFDLAMLVYEDFCAMAPVDRGTLLRRIRRSLRPGGRFVMDVTAAPRFDRERPMRVTEPDLMAGFWAPSPYLGTHERWTYAEQRLVLDRYTIDTGAQVRQFWNWMACLTPAQVEAELRAARLVPTAVLGDLTGAPYDVTSPVFAVVARRP
jgi:cyclopropane fatty-acyl-phospholipid synthase-like methyltransferase